MLKLLILMLLSASSCSRLNQKFDEIGHAAVEKFGWADLRSATEIAQVALPILDTVGLIDLVELLAMPIKSPVNYLRKRASALARVKNQKELLRAIYSHNSDQIRKLLKKNVFDPLRHKEVDNDSRPNLYDDQYKYLHIAAEEGDENVVRELLESDSISVNDRDSLGRLPIHVAVESGATNIVSQLIKKGSRVNAKDDRGNTPLHIAAAIGDIDSFNYVLKTNNTDTPSMTRSDIDLLFIRNSSDMMPIHLAAASGHVSLCDLIIKIVRRAGDESDLSRMLEARDSYGRYPIHMAALSGRLSLINSLLKYMEKSSDKSIYTTFNGATPLHYLAVSDHLIKAVDSKYVMEIEGKVGKGVTTFIKFIPRDLNSTIFAEILSSLARNLTYSQSDHSVSEKKAMLRLLLSEDKNGMTPLHYAAIAGNKPAFEYIMKIAEILDYSGVDFYYEGKNRRVTECKERNIDISKTKLEKLKLDDWDQFKLRDAFKSWVIFHENSKGMNVIEAATLANQEDLVRFLLDICKGLHQFVNSNKLDPGIDITSISTTIAQETTARARQIADQAQMVRKYSSGNISFVDLLSKGRQTPPLHIAAAMGNLSMCKLFSSNFDTKETRPSWASIKDVEGRSALAVSCVFDKTSTALYLLSSIFDRGAWGAVVKREAPQEWLRKELAEVAKMQKRRRDEKSPVGLEKYTYCLLNPANTTEIEEVSGNSLGTVVQLGKLRGIAVEFSQNLECALNENSSDMLSKCEDTLKARLKGVHSILGQTNDLSVLISQVEKYGPDLGDAWNFFHHLVDLMDKRAVEHMLGKYRHMASSLTGIKKKFPLNMAVVNGDREMVSILGRAYPGIMGMVDGRGRTPLFRAAKVGDPGIVEEILAISKKEIEVPNNNGRTPLAIAALRCNVGVVRVLMSNGANASTMDHQNKTPLMLAVWGWGSLDSREAVVSEIMSRMSDYEINYIFKRDWNSSPLHLACIRGSDTVVVAMVNHLLERRSIQTVEEYGKLSRIKTVLFKDNMQVIDYIDNNFDVLSLTSGLFDYLIYGYRFVKSKRRLASIQNFICWPDAKDNTPAHLITGGSIYDNRGLNHDRHEYLDGKISGCMMALISAGGSEIEWRNKSQHTVVDSLIDNISNIKKRIDQTKEGINQLEEEICQIKKEIDELVIKGQMTKEKLEKKNLQEKQKDIKEKDMKDKDKDMKKYLEILVSLVGYAKRESSPIFFQKYGLKFWISNEPIVKITNLLSEELKKSEAKRDNQFIDSIGHIWGSIICMDIKKSYKLGQKKKWHKKLPAKMKLGWEFISKNASVATVSKRESVRKFLKSFIPIKRKEKKMFDYYGDIDDTAGSYSWFTSKVKNVLTYNPTSTPTSEGYVDDGAGVGDANVLTYNPTSTPTSKESNDNGAGVGDVKETTL